MSRLTSYWKTLGVRALSAGGLEGSPLWRDTFPEGLARKEALSIVWRIWRQKGPGIGSLKTYLTYCVRLREEMAAVPR